MMSWKTFLVFPDFFSFCYYRSRSTTVAWEPIVRKLRKKIFLAILDRRRQPSTLQATTTYNKIIRTCCVSSVFFPQHSSFYFLREGKQNLSQFLSYYLLTILLYQVKSILFSNITTSSSFWIPKCFFQHRLASWDVLLFRHYERVSVWRHGYHIQETWQRLVLVLWKWWRVPCPKWECFHPPHLSIYLIYRIAFR